MTTSHERFEEETRELALLVQGDERAGKSRGEAPRGKARARLTSPLGFVQAWAWWRRSGQSAPGT